jgi:hypothetical protein
MRPSVIREPSDDARAEALRSGQPTDAVADLVGIGDFLAPEAHREGGVDAAASAVREWAEDDVEMIAAAERVARRRHHDDSAEILHRARLLAAA